jgi:serine/threonine protein kinase
MVYKITERAVVKLPYQYPVGDGYVNDEVYDHLHLSLQSLALFKREKRFYDLLFENPHSNIARRLRSEEFDGFFLECLSPIEEAWSSSMKEMRYRWIQELLSALEWIEGLGYIHGDIAIRNMGVDYNNRLKVFDFGSIMHRDDNGFDEQVLDDHFNLATCIHFLASGTKPLESELKQGKAVVEEGARELKSVIQAGWMKIPRSPSSFSRLQKTVTNLIGDIAMNGLYSSSGDDLAGLEVACHSWLSQAKSEPRWMNEEDYRAAWKGKGYQLPEGY